ncbi:MAG: hypothetical protein DVB31_13045 [Verrucomicrobia bacterium]|nr:MAG: hypothetical protein DVB31_13045 [Verrucomicrobiota bacterium]
MSKSEWHASSRLVPARAARLALLLGIGLLSATRSAAAPFRAGAAAVDITPPIGTVMNGGTAPAVSTHVHDPLHARALVLDDGTNRLAWVVVDNCLIDRPLFDEAKRLVRASVGLPPDALCLSTTHTHSAGSATGVHLSEPDPAYRQLLPGRIADAVRIAANRLAPAAIGWASGTVPQHVFNRRIRLRPGTVYTNLLGKTGDDAKMNWSSPSPEDLESAGPVDPELFVVSVRHADGRPLALLANYSLHYVGGVGGGHLSADYYGEFCGRIARLLGAGDGTGDPPFVAMLSNGTSGDINNVDFRTKAPQRPPYAQIRRVANDVAREAARLVEGLRHRDDVALRHASMELPLSVRKPTPDQVAAARGLIHGRATGELRSWPEIYAREQLLLDAYPSTVSLPVQLFRIGDLEIAQWPGEIFASSGLALKAAAKPGALFNIGLANGWYGYIPPPEQHALGAYETWRARTSPLETNAIPRLLEAFAALRLSLR